MKHTHTHIAVMSKNASSLTYQHAHVKQDDVSRDIDIVMSHVDFSQYFDIVMSHVDSLCDIDSAMSLVDFSQDIVILMSHVDFSQDVDIVISHVDFLCDIQMSMLSHEKSTSECLCAYIQAIVTYIRWKSPQCPRWMGPAP